MSSPGLITIHNLGIGGVNRDLPSHYLPPEVWSDAGNMRFYNGQALRFLGHTQVFSTPSVAPGFIVNVPAVNSSFWLYASKTAVYGYDSGVHTDISRAAGGAYTAEEYRDWGATILGGIPILNNRLDVPQAWMTQSLGTKLTPLSNWPSTLRAKVVRAFGNYLVAINLIDSGIASPVEIRWSHKADPGSVPSSWDYTDPTVDAGRTFLTDVKGGELLDAQLLGDFLYLYKKNSTHIFRFVGGNDIFAPSLLHNHGVIATRCVAVVDAGRRHFLVTPDDVIMHSGTKDVEYVLEGKNKTDFFTDLGTTHYANMFVFDNPAFKEAWIAYPSSGSTLPDKAIVYNYLNKTVAFRDWNGSYADIGDYTDSTAAAWSAGSTGWDVQTTQWNTQDRRRLVFADPTATKMYGLDSGYPFGAATTTSFLERTGLAIIGKDRQGQPKVDFEQRKLCTRVWARIRGDAEVYVRLGSQETLEGAVTWSGPSLYDPDLGYVDLVAAGRALAVRFESTSDLAWQLESYGLEVAPLGRF